MTNPFNTRLIPLNGPARDMIPVAPDDATDLPTTAVALYAEGGGTVAFVSASGQSRTVSVTDFALLPVGITRVMATGTTATGLHAMVIQ